MLLQHFRITSSFYDAWARAPTCQLEPLKPKCLFGWLVREEVLLAGLCERKILFRLKIYDRLRQAMAKRTCLKPLVRVKWPVWRGHVDFFLIKK